MARSHTPLSVWFWSAYLVSSQTPGMSAVQLRRQLGLSRGSTLHVVGVGNNRIGKHFCNAARGLRSLLSVRLITGGGQRAWSDVRMLYGAGAEPGEYDFERDAAEPSCGQPRRAIGHIHTIVGSFTVARGGATLVHLEVGDPVFAGDEVETGADSTVGIHFSDGAVFELSACARMVLSEFACDGASSSSALFVLSKGAIAFMAGKAAKGGLAIDTPIARIRGSRGGGIVSLAVAALTFAALEAVRADDQPVIDDGRVELPHGTFELVTKERVPQVIVVDDPWKTVVLQKVGSTVDVNQVTNSFERMDELGEVSRDTFAIFRDGQRDLFIQHQQHASLGSSETISDFSRPGISTVSLVSPTNLINSDFSPADRVATIPVAVAAASVPEVAAVVPTTIADIPTIGSTPATITLAALGEQTFIDTSVLDLFSPVNGTLSATTTNASATLTFGIAGGTADNSLGGYNQSLTDAYGALYLNSTTGAYTFIPNDTAINALTAPTAANFTLTVSDGTVSAQETVTFALNGANDAPTLQPVTGPTYIDTSAETFSAALAGPVLTNTSEPGLFTAATGTLIGADVDLPTQTLTYGIVGGSTVLGEVTYDVSKTGAYGTLYVNSATGNYEFVPNEAAIKALPATMATDTFTFTVSDGSLSAEQAFTVTINGVNDAPTLQPVAGPTYIDTSEPGPFNAASGTLVGADVDLPTQTLTYGIVGGNTELGEVTYDVSKTGAYGTLYVNSATGDYTFVPDDAAIKALPAISTTDEFTVTVSDGSLSAERSFTVTINGVNDQTVLTSVNSTAVSTVVSESAGDSSVQDIAAISGSVAFTDKDIGDNLTASASLPSVLINGNPLTSELSGAAADALTAALDHLSLGDGVISNGGGTQNISWTWDPAAANLDFLKAGDHLTITYAVQVGDSATQNLVFTINGTDDEVTITGIGAAGGDKTVYEANLTDGSSPNAAALTQTGTFNVSAPDGFDDLTIGDVPVVTNGVVMIPGSAIATTYGALTITNIDLGTGVVSYSYTLSHNALAPGSDVLDNISVVLTDTDGSSANDTLIVKVVDDVPKAEPVDVPISSTGSMTNVMLILDVSGSMGTGPLGQTRLDVAKEAVTELLHQYDNRGNVMVRIVTFSGDAQAKSLNGSDWLSVADAKTVIDGLSAGGNTNYDAALLTAMQAFNADGKLSGPGTQNVSYFISDGDPTANTDWPADVDGPLTGLDPVLEENGIQPSEQFAWESFLTANNIVSFALGIPTVTTPTNLNPIAFDPATGTQTADTPIIVNDPNQLANALVITIPPLTGSVLTGAGGATSNSFGGDGGFVQSITVDGVTYTFNPTANGGEGAIATSGGGSFSYEPTTKMLTVDTDTNAVGGEFAMVMTTGAFTFQPPTNFSSETVSYVLVDNDGDTAGSTLHFSVADTQQPAGIAGEPINLALSDPVASQATAINVTVSGLPSGWTLNEGTHLDDGSWTVQTTDVKSLTVTSSPDFVGAAVLNVTETWTNPDGTTGAKIIADNVEAYAPGSPIFAWSGDDTLTGSSGPDLFVFSQPIGQDVIYSFDASHDQIDLVGYAGITSFNDVASHLSTDANGDAVIALADGQSITLDGIAADSLSASNFVFDQTPVMDNAGAMTIGDGALLPLSGAINNAGTIALDSTGHVTTLELIQHGITLQGGGHLTLSDSDANLISGAAPGVTFTNADNTISGAGQLGDWQMTLVNNGTIAATGAHALIIDTGSNVAINTGTLNSTGSGGLIVNSDVSNAGLLWAHGGDITVNGSVSGAGGALITGDATLEFAAAASINVTFAGADDFVTLVLDNPAAYTGQIFGFAGTSLENSDIIDLKGITFDVGTSWTYHDNIGFNTGGILTVDDTANGVTMAVDNITFGDGEYTTANFILTSDGNGGTLIADPPEDHVTTAIDGGQTADVGGHTGSTHIADAEQALPSTLDGNAGKIAAFALDFVSDQFDFEHMDTNNGVANSQPSHCLTHADLPAPSDGSPAKLGNDNLGGLPENLGIHMAGDSDCLGNHASGSFVFNSTFAQNSMSSLEAAQIIAQSDQTVVQTVSDVLADAAHASPETIGPAAESVTIAGSEHHKLLTDFLLHG